MRLKIKIVDAPIDTGLTGKSYNLGPGTYTVGRGESADIHLPDSSRVISSSHLTLEIGEANWSVTDQSTNGTYIDKEKVAKGQRLEFDTDLNINVGPYTLETKKEESKSNLGGGFLDNLVIQSQSQSLEPQLDSAGTNNDTSADEIDMWLEESITDKSKELQSSPLAGPKDVSLGKSILDPLEALSNDSQILESSPSNLSNDFGQSDADEWWKDESPAVAKSQLNSNFTPPKKVPEPTEKEVGDDIKLEGAHSEQASPPISSDSTKRLSELLNIEGMDDEQFIPSLIESYTLLVEGVMRILRARNEAKNKLRVDRTMIAPVENNPLKFSANAHDAIITMFSTKSNSFMGASQAVSSALQDIEVHQAAVQDAITDAFSTMLESFSPSAIQEEAQEMGIKNKKLLAGSKLWDFYEKRFEKLIQEKDSSFEKLFGQTFSAKYESLIRKANK